MIVYLPYPFEVWDLPVDNLVNIKLASGGILTAELQEYNKLKVISISSTDPSDYLKDNLMPGSIISLNTTIE
ncbi:MAG: hypothetical protein GX333_07975 [Syntrophomonadaceae bacterium]|nr:hypothetical protein [Syntrophomonadaceae bacterium]